jgi:hypothetical protein
MSLLTICQTAAEEIGFDAPSSIIGNTDATAVRLHRLADRTGKTLAKKDWDLLLKEYTFSTVAAEPQYALPSDYRSMAHDTAWNQNTNQPLWRVSRSCWAYEKSSISATYDDRFRLFGDDAGPDIGARFTIIPTPDSAETIYYQYFSTNWLTDSGGTTERSAFAADGDVTVFDEEIVTLGVIWRLLKSLGQPYLEERAEYDRQVEICMAQDGVGKSLHADGNSPTLSNIPETGFG